MNKLISVIVPIYKVELYLEKCLESILNQTYTNLEIILVDDGSPDKCPDICDHYQKIDNRIKVIHKKNGGLSDARNSGLKIATGEFVSFIDSDDYIDINMYEKMMNYAEEFNLDIVECGVKHVYKNGILDNDEIDKCICDSEEALKYLMLGKKFHQIVCNKIYKTELIRDILFEKGKIHEDEFWTYKIFMNAKRIGLLNENLYFYFHREGSIMSEGYTRKSLDGIEARYLRYKDINKLYPNLSFIAKKTLYFYCIYIYQKFVLNEKNNKENMNEVKKYLKEIDFHIEEKNLFNRKEKIWYYLSKKSIYLTCKLRNFIKLGV